MTWILILVLTGSHGGSIAMQEFSDQASCEAAGRAAKGLDSLVTTIRYACVRKGGL
jgi:hypothetical protein